MTTVSKGASVEASTASPAAGAAGAIVAALARAGTRLMFGVPGGGPNLDVVGAACAVSITVAKFRDVADGIQPGQFMIGDREPVASLADLDRSTSGCSTSR
jgi:hypothetical protein